MHPWTSKQPETHRWRVGLGKDVAMRILELALCSSDVAAQRAFWGGTLGLPVRELDDGAIEVSLRASRIRFEAAPDGLDARYHFAINVRRGSIRDAEAWLSARHPLLAFHGDPDVEESATVVQFPWGPHALYFLDGGGNVAELLDNDHLDNAETQAFGPGALIEVAEIGLATADTAAMCEALLRGLSAEILWGGEGSLLTAIGDDHGVLIVTPTGRGWIPIGLPARPLPTGVVVAGSEPADLTLDEGPYRIRAVVG
jgi:hypothetical protein